MCHEFEEKKRYVAISRKVLCIHSSFFLSRADAEHVIVKRALSRLGNIGYNMLWSNCEHFASWCRYGMAWSEQVDKFMRVIDRFRVLSSV